MATPDDLERQFTLLTAAARYDRLRMRDALAPPMEEPSDGDEDTRPLTKDEALELLALGEVIMRKASYGRQLAVRTARAAGASWAQIGAALATSKQSAWEAHTRWLEEQDAAAASTFADGLEDKARRRARAARRILAVDDARAPNPAELRAELEEVRGRLR